MLTLANVNQRCGNGAVKWCLTVTSHTRTKRHKLQGGFNFSLIAVFHIVCGILGLDGGTGVVDNDVVMGSIGGQQVMFILITIFKDYFAL